jgi:hypothetical protein
MLTSSEFHSIQTGITTILTIEDFLHKLGKELAEVSEEAIQNTVEQTRVSASEPPKKGEMHYLPLPKVYKNEVCLFKVF